MAKHRSSFDVPVTPDEAMRCVEQVVDADHRLRIQTRRGRSMTVTTKATAFSRPPTIRLGFEESDHGTQVDLSGTVVGFGASERKLVEIAEVIEHGLSSMAGT